MASKLFTIHGAPELTEEIHSRVLRCLKETGEQKDLLQKVLTARSSNLGLLGFLRFRILHREFYEKEIKAIRLMVVSARCATQSFKKWQSHFQREK